MSKIRLKGQRIQRMGNYFYVSIPKSIVDNDLLNEGENYNVTFEEVDPQND